MDRTRKREKRGMKMIKEEKLEAPVERKLGGLRVPTLKPRQAQNLGDLHPLDLKILVLLIPNKEKIKIRAKDHQRKNHHRNRLNVKGEE